MATLNKKNSKESRNYLLVRSRLRKECMKMMKFIIGSKNNEESKKRRNKDVFSNRTKEVTKSQIPLAIKMIKFGIRYFPNKSLLRGQSLKSHLYLTSLVIIR